MEGRRQGKRKDRRGDRKEGGEGRCTACILPVKCSKCGKYAINANSPVQKPFSK